MGRALALENARERFLVLFNLELCDGRSYERANKKNVDSSINMYPFFFDISSLLKKRQNYHQLCNRLSSIIAGF